MGTLRELRRLSTLLVAVAAACVAAPAAEVAPPIAPGVRVGDVELGGLTAQPARSRLEEAAARPLPLVLGWRRWNVETSRIGTRPAVTESVRRALVAEPGARLRFPAQVDSRRVRRYVDRVAPRLFRPARNARLVGLDANLRPVFSRAAVGRRVDRRGFARGLERALRDGARGEVEVPVVVLEPRVTARTFGPVIVIRRESKRLDLYDGRRPVRSFPIATGQASFPTPLGRFSIATKQRHPWWYPPPSDWARGLQPVPPGPGNPLGTRWMGLSAYSVGIHGTPDAASVGYSASHGCIRMYVPEAEWLFERVHVGTPVLIVSA